MIQHPHLDGFDYAVLAVALLPVVGIITFVLEWNNTKPRKSK